MGFSSLVVLCSASYRWYLLQGSNNGCIGKFQFFVNLPFFNTFQHGIANYQSFLFLVYRHCCLYDLVAWVAAFISDCNRLFPELLLKLLSIFSNGAYLLRVTRSMSLSILLLLSILFLFNFDFFVGVMKELLSWESMFSFCRFKLLW